MKANFRRMAVGVLASSSALMVSNLAFSASSDSGTRLDCSPLDPRVELSKETENKATVGAQTLFKIAKAGGSIDSKASTVTKNLQDNVPISEETNAKNRLLYLFCEMVSKEDFPSDKKFELYNKILDRLLPPNSPLENNGTASGAQAQKKDLSKAGPQIENPPTNSTTPSRSIAQKVIAPKPAAKPKPTVDIGKNGGESDGQSGVQNTKPKATLDENTAVGYFLTGSTVLYHLYRGNSSWEFTLAMQDGKLLISNISAGVDYTHFENNKKVETENMRIFGSPSVPVSAQLKFSLLLNGVEIQKVVASWPEVQPPTADTIYYNEKSQVLQLPFDFTDGDITKDVRLAWEITATSHPPGQDGMSVIWGRGEENIWRFVTANMAKSN